MTDNGNTVSLYSGDDLDNAYERTVDDVRRQSETRPRLSREMRIGWAARSALNHAMHRFRSVAMDSCVEVMADSAASDKGPARLRYVGEGKNLAFLSHAFGIRPDTATRRPLGPLDAVRAARRAAEEDVLLLDTESPLLRTSAPALRLPPWIKQRLTLPDSWPGFVSGLSRGTRQEVRRCLRKYGYEAAVSNSDADFESFYSNLYRPHTRRQHGEQAFIVERQDFHKQRAGTMLVQLRHDDTTIGANVVRVAGNTLWVLWCGNSHLVPEKGLKGATDVLDYFTFLFAFCRGVVRVDLGRSRPLLNDGPLLYKGKWGAELGLGALKKPPLLAVPRHFSPAVVAALARNYWVVRTRDGLEGVCLIEDGKVGDDVVSQLAARHFQRGISRLRVYGARGLASDLDVAKWHRQRVNIVDANEATTIPDGFLLPD